MNEQEYEIQEMKERKEAMSAKYARSDSQWYEYHENLVRLAYYLHGQAGWNTDDILYFFEKPWKYTNEWNEMIGEEE